MKDKKVFIYSDNYVEERESEKKLNSDHLFIHSA